LGPFLRSRGADFLVARLHAQERWLPASSTGSPATLAFMDLSNLPPGIVGQLAGMVEDFILKSQRRYAPRAVPLTPEQNTAMQPFFSADVLEQVRLLPLDGERVQDPSFYTMARMMGFKNLPSFSNVAAVTFVDVIVSHEPFTNDLLFHELVHAVQYAQMGTREFSDKYVHGFLSGGGYDGIPLERNAYELEARYQANPTQVFSVPEEVKGWIQAGRF
jgi:hypothetical protein